MPTLFGMPKLGMNMVKGTIVQWLVAQGDMVEEGQPLLQVETDKVVQEIEAPVTGVLAKIVRQEGEEVPCTHVIAVLTDAGSAQGTVINAARTVFGELPPGFVPGHPIAGTEQSGVEASFPELYRNRRVILTPLPETDPAATARVCSMWEAAGAQVVEMEPLHHDEVLAATSHLPHVLAFTLVESLARLHDKKEIFEYAAGGFRDFTRIASGDPVMWRDICLANGDAIQSMIDRFIGDLQALSEAVHTHDGQQLLDIFAAAKSARDRYVGN